MKLENLQHLLKSRILLFFGENTSGTTLLKGTLSWILIPLLTVDTFLIVLHIYCRLAFRMGISTSPNMRVFLDVDHSYGEFVQYFLTLWIVVVLLSLWRKHKTSPIYLVWGALFAYILVDDAFLLHERVGEELAKLLNLPAVFGLRSNDLGELLLLGSIGGLFIVFALITYRQSDVMGKITSQMLVLFLAALVFFGIFVDMLHIAIGPFFSVSGLGLIEDGGELLVMTLLASYLFNNAKWHWGKLPQLHQIPEVNRPGFSGELIS